MALLPGDDGPYLFESAVPPESGGAALLEFLASRFTYRDREGWAERIAEDDVLLDGVAERDPGRILRGGERLGCLARDFREPEVPTGWTVAACGEGWLAVSKPAGMPVHSTPRIYRQTLVWQVRRLWGEGWAPAHRLDRDTSGLVLFARGDRLPRWTGRAFARHGVEKEYLALVHGELSAAVRVEAPIGLADDPRIQLRRTVRPDGQEASTWIDPIGPDPSGRGTWIRARPLQGRTHQIRVHCLQAGHPIVGDLLYDGKGGEGYLRRAEGDPSQPSERLHLHAWTLRFPDPPPGTLPRRLECPPPPGWPRPTADG
jgi:23S rRNA pseudouridine1911/1915/1917 synthase